MLDNPAIGALLEVEENVIRVRIYISQLSAQKGIEYGGLCMF